MPGKRGMDGCLLNLLNMRMPAKRGNDLPCISPLQANKNPPVPECPAGGLKTCLRFLYARFRQRRGSPLQIWQPPSFPDQGAENRQCMPFPLDRPPYSCPAFFNVFPHQEQTLPPHLRLFQLRHFFHEISFHHPSFPLGFLAFIMLCAKRVKKRIITSILFPF